MQNPIFKDLKPLPEQVPTTGGALTAELDLAVEVVGDDAASLRHDVHCILLECHRDRGLAGVLRDDAPAAALERLAADVARRLGPRIGGRYVPKRDERAVRDAAVWKAFNGRNREEVMQRFGISRRLLYSILARRRRSA